MAEYAQRFAENRIDFSVLPDLTDQDLEKMGVVLGDRRKILRAIAGLVDVGKVAAQKTAASPEARSCSARADSVGFPGRSGWQILSALIRFWERERCRRPTLLILEGEWSRVW